ncbi:hypothetical protein XU18_0537 [Perkinsela sp. CCAP 1560/4]|nr:hypothetical protein XU18_0537 [Perkinsela sp. CCAP 1560/4]|eukprot:KNH09259.1 hypothetical protein XU18_0537 [Perkinsela sp. CCAP 1560/4]
MDTQKDDLGRSPEFLPMKIPLNLGMLKAAAKPLSANSSEKIEDFPEHRDNYGATFGDLTAAGHNSSTEVPISIPQVDQDANEKNKDSKEIIVTVPKRPKFVKFPQNFEDRISKTKYKLTQVKALKQIKSDGKTVSTGTSKANYIDPRIVFAWSKRYSVPIKKLFSQTLIKKYYWAAEVDENFKF